MLEENRVCTSLISLKVQRSVRATLRKKMQNALALLCCVIQHQLSLLQKSVTIVPLHLSILLCPNLANSSEFVCFFCSEQMQISAPFFQRPYNYHHIVFMC